LEFERQKHKIEHKLSIDEVASVALEDRIQIQLNEEEQLRL